MDAFVPIAEVVKAVGLRGEVKLYPLLDFHEPLLGTSFLVWDDGEAAALERSRSARGGVAVKPAGCDDRDQAESLVGRQLGFPRERYLEDDFPRPVEGLPFRYAGRSLQLESGEPVGTVQEVRRYATQVLLVIEIDGREVMIPAVEPILKRDDGLEGPLVVSPPEGLLDA